MGKGQGLWVKCYAESFDHDKILALAEHIATFMDAPAEPSPSIRALAVDAAVGCLMRSHLALLERYSDFGYFALPKGQEHRFTALAWPSMVNSPPVLEWMLDAGFVEVVKEGPKKTTYSLHEYEIHNRELLRKRPSYLEACRKRDSKKGTPPRAAPDAATDTAPDPRRRDGKTVRGKTVREGNSPSESPPPRTPIQEILKLWNEVKTRFKTKWVAHHPNRFGGQAQVAALACWERCQDLALWRSALEACAQDDHWAGRRPNERNPNGWRASLENFCRPTHFEKWLTVAQESDWRYAADEDMAWERWFEQVEDGEIEREDLPGDVPYEGPWPTDGKLTPKQQKQAAEVLRLWWKPNVYRKEQDRGEA